MDKKLIEEFQTRTVKVEKKSGKPFKSGNKVNTVKNVINHPILTGKKAYTFLEDDSYVSVVMCRRVKEEE